jgi:DNA-binding MarR family transcriptional regulator
MKPNGQDEQKFVHSLAVLRFIVKKMPKDVAESEISTLMALLSHLNLSNRVDEDLTSALTVNGSASASQIAELTHYDESSVRAKLKRWQSLGYVDWTKREDNRGSNFAVHCTPNPDVISKSKVDPKRSEQAREAQRIRWKKERSANVNTPEGCASVGAGCAKSDSQGALNEIRAGVSRLAPLELLSGTVSATSSGTGNRAAEQAKTNKTHRSKTTPKATAAPLKDSVPETQPGPSRIPDPAVGSSASRQRVPSAPPQVQDETSGDHVWCPDDEDEKCIYCGRYRTGTERPGQCRKVPVRIAKHQREALGKRLPLPAPAPGTVGTAQFAAMTGASAAPRRSVS